MLTVELLFGLASAWAQPDYAPAHWTPPQCVKDWANGADALAYYGEAGPAGKFFCVIHDMEGYYWTSISYLNRCDTNSAGDYNVDASIHYLVNGLQNGSGENNPSDPVAGDITQSIRESHFAWHAVCWNPFTIGTEHEGFVSNPAWFTEAMYQASAGLHRHLCDAYSIPKDRNHLIGHNEWQNSTWTTWMAANFPRMRTTCNTHTDPGQYWNWTHFVALVNGTNNPGGNYWDMNGPSAGAGVSPSGTWDTTSTNWTADPNGGSVTGPWSGITAIFSAGTDATGSYAVNVAGTQTINNLMVQYGTASFSGGQLNFTGSGTYYSNYVAGGCTAIFNTPFGGAGSPDKWGPGAAVYNAASTSAGYYTLNQGTLALGNNAALSTVRLEVGDQAGVNVVTLRSADATAHTLPNYLSLKSPTITIGGNGNLTFSGPINVNSNTLPAKTLAVTNSMTTFSGVLTNTAGFTKSGSGTLVLSGTAANTYGSTSANGNTTVSGGVLMLSKTAGVAAIANGGLIINSGGVLLLGAANQIGDAVPLTLSGGTFQTGGFSEQVGTLKLTASSVIDLGAGANVLRFAASSGVTWTGGTILTVINWSGSVSGGGSEQLIFGSNSSALTAGQVGQIRFANPSGFPAGTYAAAILSTGEVVPLTVAPAIAAQPTNVVAVVGENVTLSVGATGTPPPAYEWHLNGSNAPGGTAATLLLPNILLNQAGSYSVLITNAAGSTNSATAIVSVYPTAVPALGGAAHLSNGQFQLGVTGVPGRFYAVWASSNLTEWAPLQTNVSPFTFTDTTADSFPARYYRAKYLP